MFRRNVSSSLDQLSAPTRDSDDDVTRKIDKIRQLRGMQLIPLLFVRRMVWWNFNEKIFSQNVVNESCNDEFDDVWMIFDEYVYFMCFMILKIGNCVELGSRIFREINTYIMSYINFKNVGIYWKFDRYNHYYDVIMT